VKVKRILKKFGYPPDMQKRASETVLEQAALVRGELAEAWPGLLKMVQTENVRIASYHTAL
jgi:hypothetical protein